MQRKYILPLLLFCILLSACAASKPPPYGSPDNNSNQTQSGPVQASLNLPPVPEGSSVYVRVTNQTQVEEDLAGTLYALLQSEIGAHEASGPGTADYDISITLERFSQVPVEVDGQNTGRSLGIGVASTALGITIGGLIGGDTGALVGAGVGLVSGVTLSSSGGGSGGALYHSWQMDTFVTIREKNGQTHRTRINERMPGYNSNMQDAASTVLNNIAWAIVRAFD